MNITKEEFDNYLSEDKLLVIDFRADWCGPCKALDPVIKELSEQYKDEDRILIKKVDVDDNAEISEKYGIRSIPTILFFKDGEIVEKKVGNVSKSDLEEMIVTHL